MKTPSTRRKVAFQFVLDELITIRPTIKTMFGFTYVYLDDRLLLALRDSPKQPATNGVWLFINSEDIPGLQREFPTVPKRSFWRSGKNAWVVLASKHEDFEENVFKACELILRGDRRLGRLTRKAPSGSKFWL